MLSRGDPVASLSEDVTMYTAPTDDMQFLIDDVLDVGSVLGTLPQYAELGLGSELTTALLDEAAKFASDVVSPLRRVGDAHPARCSDSAVTIPPGYGEAIQQLGAGGWVGISAPQSEGGQGLPELFGTAACEMWNSADMAFALEPFLSAGAALAISAHANEALQTIYLEKIYSGEWSGTMNLTESGAGSDLGPMKTRAEREGDHYRIFGQKIYITWGDHDATDNIIHLVSERDLIDDSFRVFSSPRLVRFVEMEYGIPIECLPEAVDRVREVTRHLSFPSLFPVEVRVSAADDIALSTGFGRVNGWIAVHQYVGAPYESYFQQVADIMDSYGGRPHWGKMHYLNAAQLSERYPRWQEFQDLRAALDPDGTFRNEYLDRVLGVSNSK